MFEPNRRDVVGKTLMDYSKLLFAGYLASGFFAGFPLWVRIALVMVFVLLFLLGWWFSPPKKGAD